MCLSKVCESIKSNSEVPSRINDKLHLVRFQSSESAEFYFTNKQNFFLARILLCKILRFGMCQKRNINLFYAQLLAKIV